MPLILGSKSASTSPMGKLHPVGPSSREHQELSWQYLSTDQKPKFGLEHHRVAAGSMNSSRASGQDFGLQSDHSSMGHKTLLMGGDKVDRNQIHYENSLFSSSLSDLFDRKLKMSSNVASFGQSINVVSSNLEEEEPLECSEEIEAHIIGNLLPDDDDDLFCGVIEDVGVIARPNFRDETDDDIFCSGGGMELEGDSDLVKGGLNSAVSSGHPFGEQPSRTLFVTNMNSTVEDSELRMLFQQYGDIRSLYTASKHQGFVMITYYDIRAAQSAMKLLQNKPFKGWKLDIHYSVPKDNPSEKDINQGMLVIVNLETSISGDDLRHTFGVYGEVKEICETPHHTFVEFYDVRAAEAARCALNRIDIEGKKVKVEPSGPGSSRWGLMQQLPPELEQEESSGFRQGISPGSSPMRSKGFIPLGTITSHFDNGIVHGQHSAASAPSNLLAQINPLMDSSFHRISPIASVSNHGDPGHAARQMKLGFHGMPTMNNGIGIPYNSSSIMPDMDINIASRSIEGVDTKYIQRVGSRGLSSRSFEHDEHAYAGGPGNGSFPVLDLPYISNSPNVYPHHSVGPILWGNSSSFTKNIPSLHSQQMHGIPRAPSHMLNPVLPVRGAPHMGSPSVNFPMHGTLHVGSAPVNPPIWDRRLLFTGDSAELLTFHPSSLGNTGFTRNSKGQLELVPHNMLAHSKGNGINHVGISSPQQRSHMLNGRNRRSDPNANVADSKKQFELDIDRIIRGEDFRTTLMLKNIPNKYTSKMLLAAIDEHHKGTYDFIYLPIDFKNKCNVGYAFINMVEPQQIIPFFQEFNGKKWEKFNSEKVAFLAYARIQGKAALITHFQNSSLMNEDKRCRPILFHSDGPNAGDQEPFPAGPNIRSRPGRSKTIVNVECKDRSPSTSPTRADFASSSKNSD